MYLSALVETGLLGLLSIGALNAVILKTSWRARHGFFGQWMLCFWAGETVQMLSGDILTYWRVLPLYFWVLAQVVRESDDASARC
jgi:O-antigen ligase